MGHNYLLQFDSTIENITEVNKSFCAAVLRVCYTGMNRNHSYLSKEAIERAIPSMYNCPIVCNYDVESDTIGGHDMTVVKNDAGELRLIHLTDAVGVVPSGAKAWWEDYNGHEYFNTEVILWRRSPAFHKIETDGIVGHSMEIGIERSTFDNGELYIDDFQFEAFCLLGDDVEPCFEDSALEIFGLGQESQAAVNHSLDEMIQEYVAAFIEDITKIQPSQEVVITNYTTMEGGEKKLEEKIRLAAEFGIDIDELDFALDDYSVDELREKFAEMTADPEPVEDPEPVVDFALESQFSEELIHAVEAEKVETVFGLMSRYMYMDYDRDASEVYAWDTDDWNLYGFTFALNGDTVAVDFATKKRMKFAVVPFDEGEQNMPFAKVFADASAKYTSQGEQYQAASEQIQGMESELTALRAFKKETDDAVAADLINGVFAQFEDLSGIEAYEALRTACDEDCHKYSVEDLEEKCYAIRGRNASVAKFSVTPKPARIPVDIPPVTDEPYGDLFDKYGQK